MAKFNTLYEESFKPKIKNEDTYVNVNSEGLIDNIVNWIKGEKLVAYSRFKYMNQFCRSFEDSEVNKGLWGFFMPKSEGYVTKLGMYVLGKSASQAMNNLVKSIKLDVKDGNKGGSYDNTGYESNSEYSYNAESYSPDVDKITQTISDFDSFAKTIDRNAAVMDPQPQPIELKECKAIVRILHRLEGVRKEDWLDPIEYAKDKMKNDPRFFDFKEKLKSLENLANKMEQFRTKWVKFILDEVRFEEVKTRGEGKPHTESDDGKIVVDIKTEGIFDSLFKKKEEKVNEDTFLLPFKFEINNGEPIKDIGDLVDAICGRNKDNGLRNKYWGEYRDIIEPYMYYKDTSEAAEYKEIKRLYDGLDSAWKNGEKAALSILLSNMNKKSDEPVEFKMIKDIDEEFFIDTISDDIIFKKIKYDIEDMEEDVTEQLEEEEKSTKHVAIRSHELTSFFKKYERELESGLSMIYRKITKSPKKE